MHPRHSPHRRSQSARGFRERSEREVLLSASKGVTAMLARAHKRWEYACQDSRVVVGESLMGRRQKICREGTVLESANSRSHRFGVETRSSFSAVLKIVEVGFCRLLPKRIIFVRGDGVEVDEACAARPCGVGGPGCVAIETANNFALEPEIARRRRTDDDRSAFGLCIGDVLAQIPSITVNRFFLMGSGRLNVVRLISISLERCAIGIVLRVQGVVVSELNDDPVSGLQLIDDLGPGSLLDVSAAASSTESFVVNVNLDRIEHGNELGSPSPWASFSSAGSGMNDRIPNRKQRGMLRRHCGWRALCAGMAS